MDDADGLFDIEPDQSPERPPVKSVREYIAERTSDTPPSGGSSWDNRDGETWIDKL